MNSFRMNVKLSWLSPACWLLLSGTFLIYMGNFLVIPFFAVYLQSGFHYSMPQIGIILMALMFGEKGLSILLGHCADRFSSKNVILAGLIIRAFSYILVPFAYNFLLMIVIAFFMGLGGALYAPAAKKSMILLTAVAQQLSVLSIRNMAVNIGTILGPLIGLALLQYNFKLLFYFAFIIHLAYVAAIFYLLPKIKQAPIKINNPKKEQEINIMGVFRYVITGTILSFFYLQIVLIAPLYINSIYGKTGITTMFIANSIIVIFFSLIITRAIVEKISVQWSYSIVSVLMILSFILIMLLPNIVIAFFAIFLFTIGECILFPAMNKDILNLFRNRMGAAFGLMDFCAFTGSLIINFLGMYIYTIGIELNWTAIYWFFCIIIGTLLLFYIYIMNSRFNGTQY